MKILVVGGGGREHGICLALSKSHAVQKIYAAPGNGGMGKIATCVNINSMDFDGLIAFAKKEGIDLTICPMDGTLVAGIVDAFEGAGLSVFGPDKKAAQIEGSKIFAKDFMKKYNIPTAEYATFESYEAAKSYVATAKHPLVIKADGLAAGKGVIISDDVATSNEALHQMFNEAIFGTSGEKVVIEEFMTGPECSVLCFCDGKTIIPMVSAKDHKAAYDGDKGPNTGGMGVIAPNPYYTQQDADETMEKILIPTMKGFEAEGINFVGVLFLGLMMTTDGVKVIEYNCRPGDPETQTVLPLLDADLLDIITACMNGELHKVNIKWKKGAVCNVVAASGGYPGDYKTGLPISGLDNLPAGVHIIHAGTKKSDGALLTNGGRVLNIIAQGDTLENAHKLAYEAVQNVQFEGIYYRKDIGKI